MFWYISIIFLSFPKNVGSPVVRNFKQENREYIKKLNKVCWFVSNSVFHYILQLTSDFTSLIFNLAHAWVNSLQIGLGKSQHVAELDRKPGNVDKTGLYVNGILHVSIFISIQQWKSFWNFVVIGAVLISYLISSVAYMNQFQNRMKYFKFPPFKYLHFLSLVGITESSKNNRTRTGTLLNMTNQSEQVTSVCITRLVFPILQAKEHWLLEAQLLQIKYEREHKVRLWDHLFKFSEELSIRLFIVCS